MGEDTNLERAQRLIGQHPAALRSVCWGEIQNPTAMQHLEIETKHGHVVVFDHEQPRVYCNPPQPVNTGAFTVPSRQWRDLTEQIPEAFNNRPVIVALVFEPARNRWKIELSTNVTLVFMLSPTSPLLSAS